MKNQVLRALATVRRQGRLVQSPRLGREYCAGAILVRTALPQESASSKEQLLAQGPNANVRPGVLKVIFRINDGLALLPAWVQRKLFVPILAPLFRLATI